MPAAGTRTATGGAARAARPASGSSFRLPRSQPGQLGQVARGTSRWPSAAAEARAQERHERALESLRDVDTRTTRGVTVVDMSKNKVVKKHRVLTFADDATLAAWRAAAAQSGVALSRWIALRASGQDIRVHPPVIEQGPI